MLGIFFTTVCIYCIYKREFHALKKISFYVSIRLYWIYSAIILGKPAEAYEIG
jgi:hypothetical protein